MTQAPLEPEKLLGELGKLWRSLAQEKQGAGLLRACSMTLLIASEAREDGEQLRRIAGAVMRDSPSRTIIISLRTGAAPAQSVIDARVFAECRRSSAGTEQICSEGIEIAAGASQLEEVARLAAPLVARDLPVTLWCRGARVFSSNEFDPLFPLARKIIVDSCSAADARPALFAVKRIGARHRIGDLAWTRITGWREALADRFAAMSIDASALRSVSVRYGSDRAEACAHYLKYWIARAAPSARVDFERNGGEDGIRDISVSCAGAEFVIRQAEARSMPRQDAELIAEEAAITGPDPVFEDLLSRM